MSPLVSYLLFLLTTAAILWLSVYFAISVARLLPTRWVRFVVAALLGLSGPALIFALFLFQLITVGDTFWTPWVPLLLPFFVILPLVLVDRKGPDRVQLKS